MTDGSVNDFVTNRLLRDAQVLPIWEGTENVLALDVLRALDREDAHEPRLETVQARLDAIDHPALADAAEAVESAFHDLGGALAELAAADEDYAQLSAKQLARLIFDVVTASVLLEEAQTDLAEGDGRTALVARRFVDRHLTKSDTRDLADEDRFPLEHFDVVVRYASVEPASLE